MKRTWTETLRGFDTEQITQAVADCQREVKFPPTLPEFVELVRGHRLPSPAPAIEYKPAFVPERSRVEQQAIRDYPRPANGFGTWWAKRILRLEQLGEPPPHRSLEIARQVLHVRSLEEFSAKYPPGTAT